MPKYKTLQVGNPNLRKKSSAISNPASPEVQSLIQDLTESMREEHLVGEAAPQLGKTIRLFVAEIRSTKNRDAEDNDESKLRVFINPEITWTSSEEITDYEGCGSVAYAKLFGEVSRPKEVEVTALDKQGKPFTLKAEGLLGRVIQHEYDHLEGILFTDKLASWETILSQEEYIKMKNKKKRS